ncbi:MAG: 2Fe-2S iron-sulfur cluster-binding protein [Alphaproteobacteria bacterium]|nr:2Fe-2S iron-sulfur cluster-binding protein [Alphaproteobacteria bacterium]MDP3084023.1 2Fe-2S iron-sulfur cluster-binding protein [Rubrivivax sp.]
MITIYLDSASGGQHSLRVATGQSLMRAICDASDASDAGVDCIAADCGGVLSCATCHVVIADDWAPRLRPASTDELAMLAMTAEPASAGSRLSCQVQLDAGLDGLRLRLPACQY